MRKFVIVLAFLIGLTLVLGSSGNFRAYTSTRTVDFSVVSGNNSYVGYMCSSPVMLNASSGVDFRALTVMNLMDKPISFYVTLNDSSLPEGLHAEVDGSVHTLEPGQSMDVAGGFSADSDVPNGTYEVPLTIHAYWDGGSALIKDCSMFVRITRPTYILTKAIVGGRYTYRAGETYTIVMQLNFTNNGPAGDFVIFDSIPYGNNTATHHINVSSIVLRPLSGYVDVNVNDSCGCYHYCHCCGCCHHGPKTAFKWHVHVRHGETVSLDIVMTATFHRHGEYILNCGAHLCGTDVSSNKIVVKVVGRCSRC
ncbi:hypothetical protein [Thermococcus sp.]|uniref:COG1470 family protein n=1 Tax=Thermococcus sp. TaxID=35749 RepID=UPI002606B05A|nr:hypothetical protein [Thermococcus sp.]